MIKPAGGEIKVSPLGKTSSNFHIDLTLLNRVAIFSIGCKSPYMVTAGSKRSTIGLTIPIGKGFKANINNSQKEFWGSKAHILSPIDNFKFQQPENNNVLVCNVDYKTIKDSLQRLNHSEIQSFDNNTSLSLANNYGAYLHRYLNFLFREIRQGGPLLKNELFSKELEESIIIAYSLALNERYGGKQLDTRCNFAPRSIRKAEEYILDNLLNPVSLASLTEVAGIPARTLLRLFKKQHGVSPIKFLRQKRYEAAYIEIASADSNDTSVLEIAMKYGFSCGGRFAKEYRKIFHELPSETLKRR